MVRKIRITFGRSLRDSSSLNRLLAVIQQEHVDATVNIPSSQILDGRPVATLHCPELDNGALAIRRINPVTNMLMLYTMLENGMSLRDTTDVRERKGRNRKLILR